ncbi:hypothetical protein WCU61_13695 [Pectobacterium versatile]
MLSHDVEHANNALSPIFNKEKELKAQKAEEAKGDSKVKRPQDGDSVA